jgi:hypothetical protein
LGKELKTFLHTVSKPAQVVLVTKIAMHLL